MCATLKSLQIFSVFRQSQPNRFIDHAGNRAVRRFRFTAESPVNFSIKIHGRSFRLTHRVRISGRKLPVKSDSFA